MQDLNTRIASPSISVSLIGKMSNYFGGGESNPLAGEGKALVDRFRDLFAGHRLNALEVLRVVPDAWGWTPAHVTIDENLLASCTSEQIAWFADTFGVRRGWLEGDGERIYDWPLGYKQPAVFAQTLRELGWLTSKLRMTVLSAGYKRGTDGPLGLFTIVFSHPILEWDDGERTLYRHLNFDADVMDWDYQACRLDAFALTSWRHRCVQSYGAVPIVPCSRATVEAVADGTAFPGPAIPWGVGGFDRLEDRVVESPIAGKRRRIDLEAKEFEETCVAQQYAKSSGLMAICRQEAISE